MYIVPLALIVLIALAIFFSPILAVIILVVFLIGLGAFKFLGPGTEPENAPSNQAPPPANAPERAREETGGAWGETWPEQEAESKNPS